MSNKKEYTENPPPYSANARQFVQPQVIHATIVPVGPDSISTYCPSCHAHILTRVEHKSSTKTHLMALVLLLVFWPCTCLPYVMDSCQNANHYCPNCNAYIGKYDH